MAQSTLKHLRQSFRHAWHHPKASLSRLRRAWRAGIGLGWGMLAYPLAWIGARRPSDPVAQAVSDLLILGFYGARKSSLSGRLLARQMRRGQVGGVFFVGQNIGPLPELIALLQLFRAPAALSNTPPHSLPHSLSHSPPQDPPLIAIDHEGGIVQRITKAHGVSTLPAARKVAMTLTPAQAQQAYAQAGHEIAALGFNLNLGPVLDFHDPPNPAIGRPQRSYGSDPATILAYATAFVQGFSSAGVLCTAKHFPGHGHSATDSHYGMADISARWTPQELHPFAQLFATTPPPAMVMMGHLRLDKLDPDGRAATLSAPIVTGLLRQDLGYSGVIMTDDIDMEAISHFMPRQEAFIQALVAGNDLIMIKNLFGYDPLLPQKAVGWVLAALNTGRLSEERLFTAAARVRAARAQLCQQQPNTPQKHGLSPNGCAPSPLEKALSDAPHALPQSFAPIALKAGRTG